MIGKYVYMEGEKAKKREIVNENERETFILNKGKMRLRFRTVTE